MLKCYPRISHCDLLSHSLSFTFPWGLAQSNRLRFRTNELALTRLAVICIHWTVSGGKNGEKPSPMSLFNLGNAPFKILIHLNQARTSAVGVPCLIPLVRHSVSVSVHFSFYRASCFHFSILSLIRTLPQHNAQRSLISIQNIYNFF